MKTFISKTLVASLVVSTTLSAFGIFDIDIDTKIHSNSELIKEYQARIEKLEKENKYLASEKAKNPKLYEKKPLFEDLKDKYIYRVKLYGTTADAINFVIKDNYVTISMNMKKEQKDENGYFYSSQYFSNTYAIPKDVKQEDITHKTDGDYFEIIMPKK